MELLDYRWTLDFPEDYEFLSALFARLPPPPAIPTWSEVAELLAQNPALVEINALRRVART